MTGNFLPNFFHIHSFSVNSNNLKIRDHLVLKWRYTVLEGEVFCHTIRSNKIYKESILLNNNG